MPDMCTKAWQVRVGSLRRSNSRCTGIIRLFVVVSVVEMKPKLRFP